MKNNTRLSCLAMGVATLAASIMTTGCGSGWSPLATLGSSPGNTVRFKIIDRDPVNGVSDADPVEEIQFTFNKDIDETTVRVRKNYVGGPTIFLFDEPPMKVNGEYTNHINDLVSRAERDLGNNKEVTLYLTEPLQLLQQYYIRFEKDKIRMEGSKKTLKDENDWEFTVREGVLGKQNLLAFLFPVGDLRYLDNLSTAVVIEGTNPSSVIGVATGDGATFNVPTLLRETNQETNQNGLTVSPDDTVLSVGWQEGSPNSNCNGNTPGQGDLYVSQSFDSGSTWDVTANDNPVPIDQAVGMNATNHVSWPMNLTYNTEKGTVAVWWAWRDIQAPPHHPLFSEFDTFGVYAATRPGPKEPSFFAWNDARLISEPGIQSGWPFIATSPDASIVYAIWGEAGTQENLYGPETLTGYRIGKFIGDVWDVQPLSIPPTMPPMLLPPPTGFVVVEDGIGVIMARSVNDGPRAFVIDLDAAILLRDSTYTGGEKLASGNVALPTKCGSFSTTRQVVKSQSPHAVLLPGDTGHTTLLVAWFTTPSTGEAVGPVVVNEFDVFNMSDPWSAPVEVVPAEKKATSTSGNEVNVLVFGPRLTVDEVGAVTMVWSVAQKELVAGRFVTILEIVRGGRRLPGDGMVFRELACEGIDRQPVVCSEGGVQKRTYDLSARYDLNGAPRCSGSVQVSTHRTGRILIAWTEQFCNLQGPSNKLASLFRSFE